ENLWGKDGTGKDVELHLYRSMIGSLMYLFASRPDIVFAVYACARHQVIPKECHLHVVKRIFRYLKGHPKLGLWYPKASLFDLVAFSDSDYGGASQDRKSTTEGSQFLDRRLISWEISVLSCKYWSGESLNMSDFMLSMSCEALSKEISISILSLLIPLVSKDDTTIIASCKTCWSFSSLRHCEKGEYNTDFHLMMDFIAASPLRRNLKLQDEDGIVSLPDTELFENLTLMGRARIAQSSALPTIADEHASLVRDVSEGEACPTNSGFIVDQDRATIAKSSSLPYDSAPRVTSPVAAEGNEGEATTERISDDSEEMVRVLTSMDAATVLAGVIDVPTGSGFIPTTGPSVGDIPTGSNDVPTASLVFATATVVTPYSRRKGKEVMVKSDIAKKQRFQEHIDAQVARELEEQQKREDKRMTEHIARDAEVARIHDEE
nr:uncharacterized mitochondrial protein AtMg00810-like [Tanacetum cinerariifolium]